MLLNVDIKNLVGEPDSRPLLGEFLWYTELEGAVGLEDRQQSVMEKNNEGEYLNLTYTCSKPTTELSPVALFNQRCEAITQLDRVKNRIES